MDELTGAPLSQVRSERIEWLWPSSVPRGKLTLLDGDPGIGKSLITLDLAARLSRGDALPGVAASGRPHTVLLLAAEDDAADTTRPRAEAAGANLDRLIVPATPSGLPLQFPRDLRKLLTLMGRHRPDLLVIDPIVAFLARSAAANSDQCVREVLKLLAMIADKSHCAMLLVRHLRKAGSAKALYRGSGSIGFIASARTGLLAAPHPRIAGLNVMAVTKSNLAEHPPALSYRIRSSENGMPVVDWLDSVAVDENELGGVRDSVKPRERAINWLRDELANGPRKSAELLRAAADAGIPERTLLRAKEDLDVSSRQVNCTNGNHEWYWYDPAAPWPANPPFKKPFRLPPLEPLDSLD